MTVSFKICSLLLSYPDEDIKNGVLDLLPILSADRVFTVEQIARIEPLVERLARDDLYASQENYVLLFDRSRTLSLNLFEHIHGESRNRGPAMVDLLETYRAAGLDLETSELPDHLPVFMEFLAAIERDAAREYLQEIGGIVATIEMRLVKRESDYAPLFAILSEYAEIGLDSEAVAELANEPVDNPNDFEALDRVWEEAEVTFGPSAGDGCPAARDVLNRMAVPKEQPLNVPVHTNTPT